MSVAWQFYRFDYSRFQELRPALRVAQQAEDFLAVSDTAITDSIVQTLEAGEIDIPSARNLVVQALCCVGEPLPLDPGLLRIITRLAHARGTEDLGEQLEGFLGGHVNVEPWMLPGAGLSTALLGLLTPPETRALDEKYGPVFRTGVKGRKRRRSGGLVGKIGAFWRQMLGLELKPEESLSLLGELIAEAAAQSAGIAVTTG